MADPRDSDYHGNVEQHEREASFAASGGWDAPKKICLCGSSRFVADFKATELELTLSGHLVLTILVMFDKGELPERIWDNVNAAHLRKIDACDEVLIINRDGYVGEATAREIEYAHTKGKPVKYKWAKHPNDRTLRPAE